MSEINYSIIIPHKNSSDLLKRCLASIPRRKDVQIIIVDDNSDFDKVDFNNFPGVGESCVEVYFTKEGRGAGYARNVGLKYAKGKWVLFADADDYYASAFLDSLDKYLDSNYDMIFYSVFSNVDNQYNRALEIQEKYNKYFSGELSLNYFKYMIWVPWNKMLKREFIDKNSITFEEIPVGNDAFFSLNACERTNNILVLKEELYCVTYNGESITYANQKSFDKQLDYLSVNLRIAKFLKRHKIRCCIVPFGNILKSYGLKYFIRYAKHVSRQDSFLYQLLVYAKAKFTGECFLTFK